MPANITRQELLIRFVLVLVCLGFWRSEVNFVSFPLLGIAWLLDGGLYRLNQTIKEPFVQAILLLCTLLLLGLLWSELPGNGRMKWLKYFILLIFIPFYSLLNRERLPWAIGGLAAGYLGVLFVGVYQWFAMGAQGIPLVGMSYLSFSAMLGVGAIMAVGFVESRSKKLGILLWIVAIALIFIQFHQNGRILLLATLIAVVLMAFLRYKIEIRKFIGILISFLIVATIFAYSSPVFQDRLSQVKSDIELLQRGNYNSSLGYRLAMWDVGLHAIAERPLSGYGTGTPERYFDNTILTYKNGLYKDLPEFQKTFHYHNDWIEIGMHIGVPGMLALLFLYWGWYQAFKRSRIAILGAGLVSYIILAGLTDAFIIFSRTPVLLLLITGIVMCWYRHGPKRI
ncbi:MAG: O-antigen ligase family protein [Nitrosomonas sp.]|uniref:O-antigen ligase family protein n=1 Tax=Nitrosomonas sp. TaxID=42353 RepID=UPI002732D6DC|nr:O-antigen ligase family protein [Nitrosomonas sp.]MDP3279534.1 O-antigen ligase family protein [Nitrosomonas sp.]MDP3664645.1 O-antigen ligase family protein [Nitrosomonas sp.]MDZ4106126.1 O-antigen ligase family protein [Nitrosomonas sp.]